MSVKRAFFSIFQKLVVFCCAIFFGFANAFSANLPSGYTELEYIESTGTQYIDTGVVPDETMDLDLLGIGLTQTSGSVRFGSRVAQNTGSFALITTNNNKPRFDYGNQNSYEFNFSGTYDRITFNHTTLTATAYRHGVVLGSASFLQNTFSSIYNIYLFAFNASGQIIPAGGYKVRYCKLWKSGNLVRNFIPAKRNSDNEIGMYDTVNNVFYTNQGTGEFTAGPAKCRNLFDGQWKVGVHDAGNGRYNPIATNRICNANMIQVKPSTNYTVSCPDYSLAGGMRWLFYDANKNFISANTTGATTVTTPSNAKYINFYIANNLTVATAPDLQLEQGSTATAYVPFCSNAIKIATTAYNTAQFNPVVNDLNTTIATIRDVVTKTINQTAAIADLQATKQTRPDEQCPAGKKCLLVETEENGVIVPHWYEIIEAPEE